MIALKDATVSDPCRNRAGGPLLQPVHAKLACALQAVAQQRGRLLPIACSVAGAQHRGIVEPRMCERRVSAHARVHCQRGLEVTFRF